MKTLIALSLALLSTGALAAGSDLNCTLTTQKGVTKTVHAKSQQTCEKRKGKWVIASAAAPAAAAPVAAPIVAPAAPAAPVAAPTK